MNEEEEYTDSVDSSGCMEATVAGEEESVPDDEECCDTDNSNDGAITSDVDPEEQQQEGPSAVTQNSCDHQQTAATQIPAVANNDDTRLPIVVQEKGKGPETGTNAVRRLLQRQGAVMAKDFQQKTMIQIPAGSNDDDARLPLVVQEKEKANGPETNTTSIGAVAAAARLQAAMMPKDPPKKTTNQCFVAANNDDARLRLRVQEKGKGLGRNTSAAGGVAAAAQLLGTMMAKEATTSSNNTNPGKTSSPSPTRQQHGTSARHEEPHGSTTTNGAAGTAAIMSDVEAFYAGEPGAYEVTATTLNDDDELGRSGATRGGEESVAARSLTIPDAVLVEEEESYKVIPSASVSWAYPEPDALLLSRRKIRRFLLTGLVAFLILATAVILRVLLSGRGNDNPTLSPSSPNATCGDGDRGNGVCPKPNDCCSGYGYCGDTAEHCFDSETSCGGATVGDGACFDESHCCSPRGWCGSGPGYCFFTCGEGYVGDGLCPNDGECCSSLGWCVDPELCG